ncbi:polyketide synthase [Streptomyces benahoarensis]|nr:polyketide synthase [Streptomyces benahoarensis]
MIEAHGTGTAVGDPLELTAMKQVYGAGDQPCAVGSVKTNIGHTESASGVVGLLKTITSVRHRKVPATLHFSEWNPQIDARACRLFVPTELQPWPVDGPRIAAVSSYGVGGTNAHVIVEEAPGPSRPRSLSRTSRTRGTTRSCSAPHPRERYGRRQDGWPTGLRGRARGPDSAMSRTRWPCGALTSRTAGR